MAFEKIGENKGEKEEGKEGNLHEIGGRLVTEEEFEEIKKAREEDPTWRFEQE